MKSGANTTDRIKIAELAEEGLDADSISLKLQIYLNVVQGFMPKGQTADPVIKKVVPAPMKPPVKKKPTTKKKPPRTASE